MDRPNAWDILNEYTKNAALIRHGLCVEATMRGYAERSGADVEQLMKYVDWVRDEYAHGDYAMIHAFLVAHHFDDTAKAAAREGGRRIFTVGHRPAVTREWSQLALIEYKYDAASRRLRFSTIEGGTQERLVSL